MIEWFLNLEAGNQIVLGIFIAGVTWGALKIVGKLIAWFFSRNKTVPESTNSIHPKAVDELLAGQQNRHDENVSKLRKKHAKLKTATAEEQKSLKAEIAELQRREANPDAALEDANKLIENLKAALAREGNTEAGDDLDKATQALEAGDTKAAQKFFETIKAKKALDVDASARASFALGEIAEQDVRWKDAFEHYQEASRLKPCFAHLIRAQKMAQASANYPAAENLGREALGAAEHEFGKDSEQYGNCLNSLAQLFTSTGKFAEAEPLMRQAIAIARKTLGEDDPNYGAALNNLAMLLQSTGRFDEAEPLFHQAVNVLEKSLGPDHPTTKTVKANLEVLLTNLPPKN